MDQTKSATKPAEFDVLIVGAGVVGSALAYSLGKDGRSVALVERDLSEPDRIVGELLQPGGVEQLHVLGMEDCLEGIDAVPVAGYAVFRASDDSQVLDYGSLDGQPVLGRSFHHGRFVQRLRATAASCCNVTTIEGSVVELLYASHAAAPTQPTPAAAAAGGCATRTATAGTVIGAVYRDRSGSQQEVRAALTFVCDGTFSNFRKKLGHTSPECASYFAGLELKDVSLPHVGRGNVFMSPQGPILCYQIGSREVRALIDVPRPMPQNLADHLRQHAVPYLPKPLQVALLHSLAHDKIRTMPNNKLHLAEELPPPGALLLGDSANMRHPVTGGGMTVGLSDAVLISRLLQSVDLSDHRQVAHAYQLFREERKAHSSVINVLAGALYGVFKDQDMRDALWDYFKLGGRCQSTPMQLLGGVCRSPSTLIGHFFAVGVYGACNIVGWTPTPAKLRRACSMLGAATWIIGPLLEGEEVYVGFAGAVKLLFALYRPSVVQSEA